MTNRHGPPLDMRGYRAGEKNRKLSPEEVQWAREVYFQGKWNARELAERFDLALDSTRRMLRGDTYRNVGMQIPRETREDLDDGGMLERLLAHQRERERNEEAPPPAPSRQSEADEALDRFLASPAEQVARVAEGVDAEGETEASRALRGGGKEDPFAPE